MKLVFILSEATVSLSLSESKSHHGKGLAPLGLKPSPILAADPVKADGINMFLPTRSACRLTYHVASGGLGSEHRADIKM